jgi:hypothetical protein
MTEIEDAGSDVVQILAKLTDEVERFDSIVLNQRRLLEHIADIDSDQFNRQAERINIEAAQMVAAARLALDKMSRLAAPTELTERQTARGGRPRVAPRRRHRE